MIMPQYPQLRPELGLFVVFQDLKLDCLRWLQFYTLTSSRMCRFFIGVLAVYTSFFKAPHAPVGRAVHSIANRMWVGLQPIDRRHIRHTRL